MAKRRISIDKQVMGRLLLLKLPRSSDKNAVSAEHLLTSIHGLLSSALGKNVQAPHRVSLEIAIIDKVIGFYIWIPEQLKPVIEEQIYAQYPTVQISEVSDYASRLKQVNSQLIIELRLSENEALPIKSGDDFKVDPISSVTATLAELSSNEQAWIQLVISPADASWHKEALRFSENLKVGAPPSLFSSIIGSTKSTKSTDNDLSRAKEVEHKASKPGYVTTIRIVYRGDSKPIQAKMRIQAIASSFKQFDTRHLNSFNQVYLGDKDKFVEEYKLRKISNYNSIFNTDELAAIYHLPHSDINTPNISWANSKTAEPPMNLPYVDEDTPEALRSEVSPIAYTNFRGKKIRFGLPRSDRNRHLYILGQTGVGKSALLELLTIADIDSPYGFAIIDPHGDYAVNVLRRIPESRIDDVVYVNPADIDYPIAFNPLEIFDPRLKNHISSELINVLKPVFETWGPRLEHVIRNSILALLEYPNSTMLDITRLLSEPEFRKKVIPHIKDSVVAHFWSDEFDEWQQTHANTAIAPVLNKIGAFTSNPIIRNIISHPKSSFSIREIMDQRKILIVNLSRGLIGEDNATLLGSLFVASIQRAAMSRADIEDIDQRIPFYLYVDEFQNFATDSFKTILSEARKYGLMLTVANQYIEQMSRPVQDAIFGNVGSMISFRLSSDDAKAMIRYYEPTFSDHDLIHMHNRHIAMNITIDGERVPAFSAETVDLPAMTTNFSQQVINASRNKYTTNVDNIDPSIFLQSAPGVGSQPILTEQEKDEIVKDIGHLVSVEPSPSTKKHETTKRISAMKRLLASKKNDKEYYELKEDKPISLHRDDR